MQTSELLNIIKYIPDGVVVANGDGKIVLINPQTEKLFGYSQKELLGEPAEILLSARFHEILKRYCENHRDEPQVGTSIHILGRRKDGSEIPVEVSLSAWRKWSEFYVISAIREVSENVRMVEALSQSEERYRILFDQSPVGVYIFDKELKITQCNKRLPDILKSYREKIIGFDMRNLKDKSFIPAMERAIKGRSSYHEGFYEATTSSAKLWLSVHFSPLSDVKGKVIGGMGVVEDITERKQAEEALQDKTSQLQTIADAMTAFLSSGNWQEVSAMILRGAVSQTSSEYGFIGVVVQKSTLRILAHEGMFWDHTVNREFYENALRAYQEVGYLEFTNFDNLFGKVITTGKPVISNNPADDPRSGGLPMGHPPLRKFLGVPILKGAEVVGMIGLANRPGGYTGIEQSKIEILMQAASVIYDSYRRQKREEVLERKRMLTEEALQENQRKLATLLSNLPGYSYRCKNDKDWTLDFISDGVFELTGYTVDEYLVYRTITCAEKTHPDDRDRVWAEVQAALEKRQQFELVYRVITKSNDVIWVWERGQGIYSSDGDLLYIDGFVTDITDLVKAEADRERLLDDLEAKHEQLQTLSRRLVEIQESERSHIARELHDEIGQILTGLKSSRLNRARFYRLTRLERSSEAWRSWSMS